MIKLSAQRNLGKMEEQDMKKLTKVMAIALAAVLACGVYVAPAKAADTMDKGVKAQIGASVNADSETSSIRLLSGVDSLDYNEVGYYVTIDGTEKKVSTTKVYESIKAAGANVAAADVINGASYIAAIKLDDIANANFAEGIYVKPYWVDAAGVETVGTDRYVRVANGYDASFSVAVRVSGSDIGAGLVGINYDKDALEYVGFDEGTVLDEYAAAASNGVVKFVANVEDVTADAAADGMIINLNFKVKDATGVADADAYEFAVASTEFCNVAEEDVTDVAVSID